MRWPCIKCKISIKLRIENRYPMVLSLSFNRWVRVFCCCCWLSGWLAGFAAQFNKTLFIITNCNAKRLFWDFGKFSVLFRKYTLNSMRMCVRIHFTAYDCVQNTIRDSFELDKCVCVK